MKSVWHWSIASSVDRYAAVSAARASVSQTVEDRKLPFRPLSNGYLSVRIWINIWGSLLPGAPRFPSVSSSHCLTLIGQRLSLISASPVFSSPLPPLARSPTKLYAQVNSQGPALRVEKLLWLSDKTWTFSYFGLYCSFSQTFVFSWFIAKAAFYMILLYLNTFFILLHCNLFHYEINMSILCMLR